MTRKKRIIYFIIDIVIIAALFAIDRVSKIAAQASLMDNKAIEIISGVFELRYLENRGAAFGMLQDFRILFIIVGVVFLVFIVVVLIMIPATKKYRLLRVCLTLMSAGALGNLYDRISLDYVIDFLYFSYINFPIFNIADCYVTVSTAVLIVLFLFVFREEDLNLKEAYAGEKVHSSLDSEDPAEDKAEIKETKDEKTTGEKSKEEDKTADEDLKKEEAKDEQ